MGRFERRRKRSPRKWRVLNPFRMTPGDRLIVGVPRGNFYSF